MSEEIFEEPMIEEEPQNIADVNEVIPSKQFMDYNYYKSLSEANRKEYLKTIIPMSEYEERVIPPNTFRFYESKNGKRIFSKRYEETYNTVLCKTNSEDTYYETTTDRNDL